MINPVNSFPPYNYEQDKVKMAQEISLCTSLERTSIHDTSCYEPLGLMSTEELAAFSAQMSESYQTQLGYYIASGWQTVKEHIWGPSVEIKEQALTDKTVAKTAWCLLQASADCHPNMPDDAYIDIKNSTEAERKVYETTNTKQESPFQVALKYGNQAVLELLPQYGRSQKDHQDKEGNSLLHTAVQHGTAKQVSQVLQWGTSTTLKNNNGLPALQMAIAQNELDKALLLLDRGSFNTLDDKKQNFWHYAVALNKYHDENFQKIIVPHCRALFRSKAERATLFKSLVQPDFQGNTPIALTAKHKNWALLDLWLELVPEALSNQHYLQQAWEQPSHAGNTTVINLVAAGDGGVPYLKRLKEQLPECIHQTDSQGRGLLHLAAGYNNTEAFKLFFHPGHFSRLDNLGRYPLHYASSDTVYKLIDFLESQIKTDSDAQLMRNAVVARDLAHQATILSNLLKTGNTTVAKAFLGFKKRLLSCRKPSQDGYLLTKCQSDSIKEWLPFVDSPDRTDYVRVLNEKNKDGETPWLLSCQHADQAFSENLGADMLGKTNGRLEPQDVRRLLGESSYIGNTPLHYAAAGSPSVFCWLMLANKLENGWHLSPLVKNNDGLTPLHLAAANNQTEVVNHYIKLAKEEKREHRLVDALKQKDYFGQTPLMYAASSNNPTMIKAMLELDPSVASEKNDKGKKAVDIAYLLKDCPEAFKVLGSQDEVTNYQYAVKYNQVEVLDALSPTIKRLAMHYKDFEGQTPLGLALCYGHLPLLDRVLNTKEAEDSYWELFVGKKERVIDVEEELLPWLRMAVSDNPDFQDRGGLNYVHLATMGNQIEVFNAIVSPEKFLQKTKAGINGFHLAIIHQKENIYKGLSKELLSQAIDTVSDEGSSAAHMACEFLSDTDALETLKWLEEKGCKMDACNQLGQTIAHIAAMKGMTETLTWISKKEISVDDADKSTHGQTAKNTYGSLLTIADKQGFLPLHYLCQTGDVSLLDVFPKELLNEQCHQLSVVNKQYPVAKSPLALALELPDATLALGLLSYGSIDKPVDSEGQTVMQLATKYPWSIYEPLVREHLDKAKKEQNIGSYYLFGEPKLKDCVATKGGNPLNYAFQYRNAEVVEKLLEIAPLKEWDSKEHPILLDIAKSGIQSYFREALTDIKFYSENPQKQNVLHAIVQGNSLNLLKDFYYMWEQIVHAVFHSLTAREEGLKSNKTESGGLFSVVEYVQNSLTVFNDICNITSESMRESFRNKTVIFDEDLSLESNILQYIFSSLNVADKDGLTPLDMAVRHHHNDIVKLMLPYVSKHSMVQQTEGSYFNFIWGKKPSTLRAVGSCNTQGLEMIFDKFNETEQKELLASLARRTQDTHLMMAAKAGCNPGFHFLLKEGASPAQVDALMQTPLHVFAGRNELTRVKELIQFAVDNYGKKTADGGELNTDFVHYKDSYWASPLDYAKKHNQTDILAYLKQFPTKADLPHEKILRELYLSKTDKAYREAEASYVDTAAGIILPAAYCVYLLPTGEGFLGCFAWQMTKGVGAYLFFTQAVPHIQDIVREQTPLPFSRGFDLFARQGYTIYKIASSDSKWAMLGSHALAYAPIVVLRPIIGDDNPELMGLGLTLFKNAPVIYDVSSKTYTAFRDGKKVYTNQKSTKPKEETSKTVFEKVKTSIANEKDAFFSEVVKDVDAFEEKAGNGFKIVAGKIKEGYEAVANPHETASKIMSEMSDKGSRMLKTLNEIDETISNADKAAKYINKKFYKASELVGEKHQAVKDFKEDLGDWYENFKGRRAKISEMEGEFEGAKKFGPRRHKGELIELADKFFRGKYQPTPGEGAVLVKIHEYYKANKMLSKESYVDFDEFISAYRNLPLEKKKLALKQAEEHYVSALEEVVEHGDWKGRIIVNKGGWSSVSPDDSYSGLAEDIVSEHNRNANKQVLSNEIGELFVKKLAAIVDDIDELGEHSFLIKRSDFESLPGDLKDDEINGLIASYNNGILKVMIDEGNNHLSPLPEHVMKDFHDGSYLVDADIVDSLSKLNSLLKTYNEMHGQSLHSSSDDVEVNEVFVDKFEGLDESEVPFLGEVKYIHQKLVEMEDGSSKNIYVSSLSENEPGLNDDVSPVAQALLKAQEKKLNLRVLSKLVEDEKAKIFDQYLEDSVSDDKAYLKPYKIQEEIAGLHPEYLKEDAVRILKENNQRMEFDIYVNNWRREHVYSKLSVGDEIVLPGKDDFVKKYYPEGGKGKFADVAEYFSKTQDLIVNEVENINRVKSFVRPVCEEYHEKRLLVMDYDKAKGRLPKELSQYEGLVEDILVSEQIKEIHELVNYDPYNRPFDEYAPKLFRAYMLGIPMNGKQNKLAPNIPAPKVDFQKFLSSRVDQQKLELYAFSMVYEMETCARRDGKYPIKEKVKKLASCLIGHTDNGKHRDISLVLGTIANTKKDLDKRTKHAIDIAHSHFNKDIQAFHNDIGFRNRLSEEYGDRYGTLVIRGYNFVEGRWELRDKDECPTEYYEYLQEKTQSSFKRQANKIGKTLSNSVFSVGGSYQPGVGFVPEVKFTPRNIPDLGVAFSFDGNKVTRKFGNLKRNWYQNDYYYRDPNLNPTPNSAVNLNHDPYGANNPVSNPLLDNRVDTSSNMEEGVSAEFKGEGGFAPDFQLDFKGLKVEVPDAFRGNNERNLFSEAGLSYFPVMENAASKNFLELRTLGTRPIFDKSISFSQTGAKAGSFGDFSFQPGGDRKYSDNKMTGAFNLLNEAGKKELEYKQRMSEQEFEQLKSAYEGVSAALKARNELRQEFIVKPMLDGVNIYREKSEKYGSAPFGLDMYMYAAPGMIDFLTYVPETPEELAVFAAFPVAGKLGRAGVAEIAKTPAVKEAIAAAKKKGIHSKVITHNFDLFKKKADIKLSGLKNGNLGAASGYKGGNAANPKSDFLTSFGQKKSSTPSLSIFDTIPAPRTPGLGTHTSINELLKTGAIPGVDGVIITDRYVRFGDLYKLSTLNGRKVEFSLSKEIINGKRATVLRSGSAVQSPIAKNGRPIAHTHPTVNPYQKWPSEADMSALNRHFFKQIEKISTTKPQPHRIIWGDGHFDNTIVYPGFGKDFTLIPKK